MGKVSVMLTGFNSDKIKLALKGLDHQGRGEKRTRMLVNYYAMPNVSEKVIRIMVSYTNYIKRVVWQGKEF